MIISAYTKKIDIAKRIDRCLQDLEEEEFEFVHFEDINVFSLHLYYDMPQYTIIDLEDEYVIKSPLLQEIAGDSWLQNIGIFGLHNNKHEEIANSPAILTGLTFNDLERTLPKLLKVFNKYQNLLFRSGIFHDLSRKGVFIIDNEPAYMQAYSEILSNSLFKRNLISVEKKYCLNFCLSEMLINAIEHGNCGITSEQKQKYLEEGKSLYEIIETLNQNPEVNQRKIRLEYEFLDSEAIFIIRDEGEGFDTKQDTSSLQKSMSGRGILFSKNMMKSLIYNDKGNEVKISIDYDHITLNGIPLGLEKSKTIDLKKGDILFREGNNSNTLYYIVAGEFEVKTNNRTVNTLDSSDIFLGEMAYLLGNKRTATAIARTDARVIAIEVHEWIDVVKNHPYYAVFLAKLLAKKLDKLSNYLAEQITES